MVKPGPDVDVPMGPFDIYETMDGPRHVVNPVRRLILAKMRGAELTVPQIIEATDLTKSTISTHLNVLYRQRMVAYREDPSDRRRKRYYLTARHVATSRRCAERVIVHRPGELGPQARGQTLPRVLLRAFMGELRCSGLDVGPIVRETGRRVGELAARDTGRAPDATAWAEEARAFWQQAGLGSLRVVRTEPLTLQVDDCTLCCHNGQGGVGLCGMAAGILEGMAAESMRASVRVDSTGEGTLAPPVQVEPVDDPAHAGEGSSSRDTGGSVEPRSTGRCGCTFTVRVDA